MTITQRQLEARSSGIGSSDAAAILGFSPWRTAADVRLEKLGLLEPQPPSELAEIGTALEDGVATLAARRLNCRLVRPTATYRHESGVLAANIDRQVEKAARGQPLCEVKDSGIDIDWGEPGTDGVPAYVLVQVVHQMLCSDAREAHVARLGRGFNRGLFMFTIVLVGETERLHDSMAKFLPAWWHRHVIDQDPLPESAPPPSLDVLRRVSRVPKSTVPVPADLFLMSRRMREEKARVIEASEEADRRLLARLETAGGGHAEAGTCEHGMVTYFEQTRPEHTVKKSTFRTARFKAAQ